VLQLLEELADRIVGESEALSAARMADALRACAVAGLPHSHLFATCATRLDLSLGAMQVVEVFESCAALRLSLAELQPCMERLLHEGLLRRLPSSGLARLLAARARLGLLEAKDVEATLLRMGTVASPVRPLQQETVVTLCFGLWLSGWKPSNAADLWQVTAWLAKSTTEPCAPQQAAALRQFVLGLLADPQSCEAVAQLPEEHQYALALVMRRSQASPAQRQLASDTTLKFRHEVAEVLRKAERPYDLDLSLGPGLSVELAIPGIGGSLWLLDGPEAFHRPFLAESSGGRPLLHLVPAEQRRTELILATLAPGRATAMDERLQAWEGTTTEKRPSNFGLADSLVASRKYEGSVRIARMHWLEWARLPVEARLSALVKPEPRIVKTP